jgi:hypothetical protein
MLQNFAVLEGFRSLKTTCATKLTHKKELEATDVYNQARIHVEKY